MEDAVSVNWIAVIVATVVTFIIGALWYSPVLFVKQWQAAIGKTDEELRPGMPKAIVVGLITDLVMVYILARIAGHYGAADLLSGAFVGFIVWVGFVATLMLSANFYENRPMQVFYINAGNRLIGLVVAGAIIGAM